MSTVSITINDSDLRRGLRALESAAADMTPAMRKIAGTLHAETDINFDETGRLQGSVSTEYDPSTAMIGTNTVYGAIHQFGGKTGRNESVELPARPYLTMDEDGNLQSEAVNSVLDTIQRHLESAAQR